MCHFPVYNTMIDGDNNTLTIDNRPIAVYIGEDFPTDLSKKIESC